MSREDWEVFDQLREEAAERRRERMDRADDAKSRVIEQLADDGLRLLCPSRHHWQVVDTNGEKILNYWPSTMKMSRFDDPRHTFRDVTLEQFVRTAREYWT